MLDLSSVSYALEAMVKRIGTIKFTSATNKPLPSSLLDEFRILIDSESTVLVIETTVAKMPRNTSRQEAAGNDDGDLKPKLRV